MEGTPCEATRNTRHPGGANFLVNLIAALVAYNTHQPKKPSFNLRRARMLADAFVNLTA